MSNPDLTTGELVKAITAKPDAGPFPVGGGYLLDLAAAVKAHQQPTDALALPGTPASLRWTMPQTAILLAHPVNA